MLMGVWFCASDPHGNDAINRGVSPCSKLTRIVQDCFEYPSNRKNSEERDTNILTYSNSNIFYCLTISAVCKKGIKSDRK